MPEGYRGVGKKEEGRKGRGMGAWAGSEDEDMFVRRGVDRGRGCSQDRAGRGGGAEGGCRSEGCGGSLWQGSGQGAEG